MKWHHDIDQCTGCGYCIKGCPKQILKLSTDLNQRGTRYIVQTNPEKCIGCKNCQLMCTAGAIWFGDSSYNRIVDRKNIPDHVGCMHGTAASALSDVIQEMGIQDKVVVFKNAGISANVEVETHNYTVPDYLPDALQYKKEHPDRIVIVFLGSAKPKSTAYNQELFQHLKGEKVTIIHTLDWFETTPDLQGVTAKAPHILEEVAQRNEASFVARTYLTSPAEVNTFKSYLKKAIVHQMNNDGYEVVEYVFPCFYRVLGRPQTSIPYEDLERVRNWFLANIKPQYKAGILAEK